MYSMHIVFIAINADEFLNTRKKESWLQTASGFNPPSPRKKTAETKENFCKNSFYVGMDPKQYSNEGRDETTRRLPQYRIMTEKKEKITTSIAYTISTMSVI